MLNFAAYVGKTVLLYNKKSASKNLLDMINVITAWIVVKEGKAPLVRDDWTGLPLFVKWDDDEDSRCKIGAPFHTPYEDTPNEILATQGMLLHDLTSDLWFAGNYTNSEIRTGMGKVVGDEAIKFVEYILDYDCKTTDASSILFRFIRSCIEPMNKEMARLKELIKEVTDGKADHNNPSYRRRFYDAAMDAYDALAAIVNVKDDLMLDLRITEKQTA